MPKLRCPCGYVQDLSAIPDAGWLTVRDADYESLLAAERERDVLRAQAPAAPVEAFGSADRTVVDALGTLYECPSCGRLLWRRPGDEEYRSYMPERPAS